MSSPLAEVDLQRITEIRHDLHQHPELGFEETRTSGVVQRELAAAGIAFQAGLAKGTGVVGYLPATTKPESEARTIALRADMDALPILEATELEYASVNPGKMHACGHDGHTSILLGTAHALAHSERPNNVLLLFQPAEEGGGGGYYMCQDGALSGKQIGKPADIIFGLHGYPYLTVGQLVTRTGAMMASADQFEIIVEGKGSHAAYPHAGVDPIVVSAHIITALQSVASRNVSPLDSLVVTIGMVQAGSASNIIPNDARLVGTLRTLKADTQALGKKRIEEIASSVAQAFGATAKVEWAFGYPITFNDARATEELRSVLKPVFGDGLLDEDVEPTMGGEDFSFYGHHVPACFFWLGLKQDDQATYPNLHSPDFNFNDAALAVGIRAMVSLALQS